jgi:hypothetical protein
MLSKPRKSIRELFREGTAIDAALRGAVKDALRRHKQLGHTVVVWENGKIVRLQPEQILLEEGGDDRSVAS